MESLTRSLNLELPHELHLDKYAQQILESGKAAVTAATPTALRNSDSTASPVSNDILQKIGATLLNSIQLKKFVKIDNSPIVSSTTGAHSMEMPEMPLNHVVIDSSGFEAMDELQRQLEYDKFMNEVWIGIVLTLILISMVFCICSCFLYHQFRTWKRNYRSTIAQTQAGDSEAVKLHPDAEDPVPEYTLVSGLPSYEAALELLHKTPQACLIVYPSVFSVFNKNEKSTSNLSAAESAHSQQQQPTTFGDLTTPLLTGSTTPTTPTEKIYAVLPSYAEANNLLPPSNVSLTSVSEKPAKMLKAKSSSSAAAAAATAAHAITVTTAITATTTPTDHTAESTSHKDELSTCKN